MYALLLLLESRRPPFEAEQNCWPSVLMVVLLSALMAVLLTVRFHQFGPSVFPPMVMSSS